jgi:hypothetical protein
LATLEPSPIEVGQSVTVGSLGAPFNGTFTVLACPQYLFTGVDGATGEFMYDFTNARCPTKYFTHAQVMMLSLLQSFAGVITYTQTCTWITAGNIEDWLGIGTATAADTAFLTQCAAAANAFCYRRRQEASYFDSLTTSPSGDVTLGTIMYGGNLYRQRGAVTDFASFDGMAAGGTNGLSPMIKQLLGVNRATVA